MAQDFDNERFRKLLRAYPAKAIEFLYSRFHNNLFRIALYLTRNPEASEDIVQETFVHVWENYKQLSEHHDRSIQYYLVKVVRNKSITQFTRNLRSIKNRISYRDGQTMKDQGYSAEAAMIQSEMHHQLRTLVDTFPKREKECLMMRIDEELTVEQIALRLNVSKKAVERSITSANKRLRRYGLENGNKF